MEGNLRFTKSIGLACSGKEIYHFCFSKYKPPGGGGAYVRRGDLTEGFLHYDFVGLTRGAYFRNFTVH